MDKNVSLHRNHLLKAPFCLHPSTGNVCVAIPLESLHLFPVCNGPNVFDLVGVKKEMKEMKEEIKEEENDEMEEENIKQYLNYTFDDYVKYFEQFVIDLVGVKKEQQ